MSTWHRKMTVDIFSDEASSFRVSEIFVPALGVRQENFIICLFDVFSQVIGLNSVYFNSRKVTFRRVHNRGSQIPPSRLYFSSLSRYPTLFTYESRSHPNFFTTFLLEY